MRFWKKIQPLILNVKKKINKLSSKGNTKLNLIRRQAFFNAQILIFLYLSNLNYINHALLLKNTLKKKQEIILIKKTLILFIRESIKMLCAMHSRGNVLLMSNILPFFSLVCFVIPIIEMPSIFMTCMI